MTPAPWITVALLKSDDESPLAMWHHHHLWSATLLWCTVLKFMSSLILVLPFPRIHAAASLHLLPTFPLLMNFPKLLTFSLRSVPHDILFVCGFAACTCYFLKYNPFTFLCFTLHHLHPPLLFYTLPSLPHCLLSPIFPHLYHHHNRHTLEQAYAVVCDFETFFCPQQIWQLISLPEHRKDECVCMLS
jgi:hypothetical protein